MAPRVATRPVTSESTGGADIVLVFPPVNEARLFPYLSLPMITAYLRQQGLRVVQRDLNIELCHALFRVENFSRYLEQSRESSSSFHSTYRRAMAEYLVGQGEQLRTSVFGREGDDVGDEMARKVRFVRQGIDLLLEDSELVRSASSIAEIDAILQSARMPSEGDRATGLLHGMVSDLLRESRPSVIGISVAFFSQLIPAFLLARWVKELRPQTAVILGGQQVLLWGDELAKLDAFGRFVDFLGVGKGEQTLSELSNALRGDLPISDVPDLIRWDGHAPVRTERRSTIRLRDAPPPDFTGLPIHSYLMGETQLAIVTCIGCFWGRCTFCSYGNRSFRDKAYEQLGPEQIADWCQALVDRHGVRRINFVDENTNLRLALEGLRVLNSRGYQIRFSTRNRLERVLLQPGFCKELRERGCVLMSSGYETNSQRLLDRVDKGVDAANYQPIVDAVFNSGITLRLSVMGGLPDETEDEWRASLSFLQRNERKIGIDVAQMLVAEPGTRLSAAPAASGLRRVAGPTLQGNGEAGPGSGRMGYTFTYKHGPDSAKRHRRFLDVYRTVRPQRNDELPPDQRYQGSPSHQGPELSGVALLPWVQLHEAVRLTPGAPESDLLVDLLWQRFYRMPRGLTWRPAGTGETKLIGREPVRDRQRTQRILRGLVDLQLARPAGDFVQPDARAAVS